MERLEMRGVQDLELRRIADDRTATALFASIEVPPNSDYFPIVDNHADRARFLNKDAKEILVLGNASLPITEMLDRQPRRRMQPVSVMKWPTSERVQDAQKAEFARRFLLGESSARDVRAAVTPHLQHLINFKSQLIDCRDATHLRETWDSVLVIASLVNVSLPLEGSYAVWDRVVRSSCHRGLAEDTRRWIELFRAVGQRDAGAMATIAEGLLATTPDLAAADLEYLYGTAVLGRLARGEQAQARKLVEKYDPRLSGTRRQHPSFTFFRNAAYAEAR
jgi:hypothetical protein